MFCFLSIISVFSITYAHPSINNVANDKVEPTVEKAAKVMRKDCSSGILSASCMKIGAISVLEKLNAKDELPLMPGVSLVKDTNFNGSENGEEFAAELARTLPTKPDERLDKYLLYRLGTFLDTHSVKLRLLDEEATEEAKSVLGEARRGGGGGYLGGKKGGMGNLLAMAMMMKGTMMSIGLGGLAMLAGKALMTAMMSLLLSAVIGIKSLTSGKSTTYEIVSKPVYSHSHSHSQAHEDVGGYGHSGYGRNLNVRKR